MTKIARNNTFSSAGKQLRLWTVRQKQIRKTFRQWEKKAFYRWIFRWFCSDSVITFGVLRSFHMFFFSWNCRNLMENWMELKRFFLGIEERTWLNLTMLQLGIVTKGKEFFLRNESSFVDKLKLEWSSKCISCLGQIRVVMLYEATHDLWRFFLKCNFLKLDFCGIVILNH